MSVYLPELQVAVHERDREEVRMRMRKISAVQQQAVVRVRFEVQTDTHVAIGATQHGESHITGTHKLGKLHHDICQIRSLLI